MIQVPKILFMFAVFTARTIYMTLCGVAFFIASHTACNAANYRLSNSCGCCTAKSVIVLAGTEGDSLSRFYNFSFSFMARTMKNQSKVNNSSQALTSAHETRTIQLTGNPFIDLLGFGFNLHKCIIRHYHGKATGEFNISGRITTAVANDYEGLIMYIVEKECEYRRYVGLCRRQKRQRNWLSWLTRHPEYVVNYSG